MKKNFSEFKNFIKDKNVAVIGIGVSNIPLIDFLIKLEAKVTGFDNKTREELGHIIDSFEDKGVSFKLGGMNINDLDGFDVVFKTPSMRIDCDCLVRAKENGAYITSEIEEFVRYTKGQIYAVTGSDGKTTTTTIVSNLLKEEGYTTWVGGNIGTPLFSVIEEIQDEDKVVLELSSFQLMTMNLPVDVAIVTNVTPNHLDMHKDMDEYINSKKNIFLYQKEDAVLVLNDNNEITKSFGKDSKSNVRYFSSNASTNMNGYLNDNKDLVIDETIIANISDMRIKGIHNAENFLAAFLAVKDVVSLDTMKKVLINFSGVMHRCEYIRTVDGVDYYNDSIASSPARTIAGLRAFDKKVILIAGGYDKNIPFDDLAIKGHKYIKEIILLGDTKYKINEVFNKYKLELGYDIKCNIVNDLEEAVKLARKVSVEGDIVTLSPACASFDMFPNFMVRGIYYKDLVNALKQ